VISLKEEFNRDSPRLLAVLSGAILAVLLVACLNVASLLTVRASVRHVELSVRSALGATARRLQRQLVVEHMTLAVAGGVLGGGLGFVLHRAVIQRRLLALPRTADDFEWPAVIALFVLIAAIGIGFARRAAYRSTRTAPAASLIGAARQTGARSPTRLREVLVGGEVAAALVLLVVAALMLQSAARLAAVDPGFRTEGVLMTASVGIVLGAAASAAATRGLETLLYEVPARDPKTVGVTSLVLLMVTAAAAYFPARRALKRGPAEVLRTE
jgi:putative ABC transport system permease protein